jgi:hypothetical protein
MLKQMVELLLGFKGQQHSNTGLHTLSLYNVFICKKSNSGFNWLIMDETHIQLMEIPEYYAGN